jgi:hypothetical protein
MCRQLAIGFIALLVLVCGGVAAAQQSSAGDSAASSARTAANAQGAAAPAAATIAPSVPTASAASDGAESIARVHIYRQRRFYAWAVYTPIKVDGKVAVHLDNGHRATLKLSPGHHVIASDDKKTQIALDLKAGDEYYIRVDEYPGTFDAQGRLTMMVAQQGSFEWEPLKPVGESSIVATDLVEHEPAPAKSAKK